ncbi:MAG TPA: hypothetical protein PKJ91_04395 [Methanoregulaceae archaeon]|nr:hypothetical protein [Methanoregulaceae archaeon]
MKSTSASPLAGVTKAWCHYSSKLIAPALPLRSAAASWSAPSAARLDPPGTHPGKEYEGGFPATATSGPCNGPRRAGIYSR